jgi:hypothetical protein
MATEFRSSLILINEAKLLASAPDTVAAWLEKSSEVSSWAKDADAVLELNLLARNERLIDLALAEHGLAQRVLHELYHRNDEVLRVAVLSNQRLLRSRSEFGLWVEYWQFVNKGPDVSWMAGLSLVEAQALFTNRSLPDAFIADFFEQKSPWEVLNDGQRLSAANGIIETLKQRQISQGSSNNRTFFRGSVAGNAAWKFASIAPVDVFWAEALFELYSWLTPTTISNFDALQVAERWNLQDTDKSELEREIEYNKLGYLSTYQSVRCGLARLASEKLSSRSLILENEDVAIRCGGYSALSLSAAAMEAAFATDGNLACNYLIQNEKVWRYEGLRSALEDICSRASQDEDYIVSQTANFNREEIRLRELHPNWFGNEISVSTANHSKAVAEVSVREMAEAIVRSRQFVSLTNLMKIQAKEKAWCFCIIIAFLAVILFKV